MSTLSVNTIKDVQNFDFSNTPFLGAFTTANSGYVVANSGYNTANLSYTFGNTVYAAVNSVFTFANGVAINATAAFAASNAEFTFSNSIYAAVNSAFGVANAAFGSANNVAPQVAPAYNTANGGYTVANAAFGRANTLATSANAYASAVGTSTNNYTSATYATLTQLGQNWAVTNSAFGVANSALPLSGGTLTGALNISTGTSQPLKLTTSSAGPWALELYRSDTAFSVKTYNDGAGWYFTPYITGASSVRSPIFYDSNNTAYYTDPASTSVLNALTVGGSTVNPLVRATAVSASGSSVPFTGIPSWVRRINLMLAGVSLNGSDGFLLRLGTSSGIESASYVGMENALTAGQGTGTNQFSSSFWIMGGWTGAQYFWSGNVFLTNINGNTWCLSGCIAADTTASVHLSAGYKTLGGVLTQIQLLPSGSNTFDSGTVNILYE